MGYAEGTEVPVEKTRMEIELLIKKYGANKFAYHQDEKQSVIIFACQNRIIRFKLAHPTKEDGQKTPTGKKRDKKIEVWMESELRRRWRALLLCIKGKFEAIAIPIESFDEAFLSHIVTDDKRTIYERLFLDNKSTIKMLPASDGVLP